MCYKTPLCVSLSVEFLLMGKVKNSRNLRKVYTVYIEVCILLVWKSKALNTRFSFIDLSSGRSLVTVMI